MNHEFLTSVLVVLICVLSACAIVGLVICVALGSFLFVIGRTMKETDRARLEMNLQLESAQELKRANEILFEIRRKEITQTYEQHKDEPDNVYLRQ